MLDALAALCERLKVVVDVTVSVGDEEELMVSEPNSVGLTLDVREGLDDSEDLDALTVSEMLKDREELGLNVEVSVGDMVAVELPDADPV